MIHFVKCGDANPKGNISFLFLGGCGKDLPITEAYRCTGCGGWFHRDCIFEHFEKEESCSKSHNALRKIQDNIEKLNCTEIADICRKGLDRTKEKIKLF